MSAPPRTLIDRPRLVAAIDRVDGDNRAVAIWASVGSGKSMLMSAWRDELERRDQSVTWIEPADLTGRSLEYTVSTALDLADGPLNVMVDDAHAMADLADRQWLADLISRPDPRVQLFLAGRYRPMAIAGSRGSTGMVEIRSDGLAFTPAEAAELFQLRGIDLSDEQLVTVMLKTEGWAVALGLLAERLTGEQDVAAAIDDFASDHRGVADYLVSEVLSSKTAEMERFLLQTCVVDELTLPLAAHLSGRPDAGELLTSLEEANSLIRVSGSTEPVYRTHPMLKNYLRATLRRRNIDAARALHRSAAGWFDSHGDHVLSLQQLLEGDEPDAIMSALDRYGPQLALNGNAYLVLRALRQLETTGELSAGCHVLAALVAAPYFTDPILADYHLSLARSERHSLPHPSLVLLAGLEVMRSTAADDPEVARTALAELDAAIDSSEVTRGAAWLDALLFTEAARGWAAAARDDHASALHVLRSAAGDARDAGRSWLSLLMLDLAAASAARLGNWREADVIQQEMRHAIHYDSKPADMVAARVQFIVAGAEYEEGRLGAHFQVADIIATDALALDAGLVVPARVMGIVLKLDREPNPRKLYEELDHELQASGHSSKRTLAAVCYLYVDLTLRLHGRGHAKMVVDSLGRELGTDSLEYLVAQLMLAHGSSAQSGEERALEASLDTGVRAWNPSTIVLGWLLLAQLAELDGRLTIADGRFERAISLAASLRLRRPFLQSRGMGGAMLSSRVGRLGPHEEFAATVLDLYREQYPSCPSTDLTSMVFTAKEHEILRELLRHQSVSDIAMKQRLSPNTVKTHLRAIYQKLGVTDRSAAVEKAMSAGLL